MAKEKQENKSEITNESDKTISLTAEVNEKSQVSKSTKRLRY